MLQSTLSFRIEVRCWFSYFLSVAPSSDGKGSRTSLGALLFCVLLLEKFLLSRATIRGSCTHPDQSWNWLAAQRSTDLCVETSSPILLFFIIRGVAPT